MEKNASTVGGRMRALRGDETIVRFAEKLGVHRNTLPKYEADEVPPDGHVLTKLFELGFNPGWVLTGEGQPRAGTVLVTDANTTHVRHPAELVHVRRWRVRAAAGAGANNDETSSIDTLTFRRQFLEFLGVSANSCAIVRVQGDSMEGALIDGDTVMIDTSDTRIQPPARDPYRRRAYVIQADGELRCKYVELIRAEAGERWLISSKNQDYPSESCGVGAVEVVGRVRWSAHSWL